MDPTPEPPYYAVIFSSRRSHWGEPAVDAAYDRAAARMEQLAASIPGFLGIDSARNDDGTGITVSYWADEAAIERWRTHPEHLDVQTRGRANWYDRYELHVARVERARVFA